MKINQSRAFVRPPAVLRMTVFAIFSAAAALLFCGQAGAALSAADQSLFQEANRLYRGDKYEQAAQGYQKLAEAYPEESVFQFNLGNAQFRLKHSGAAILAYEKARMLSPRSRDIRANLNFALSQLEYRVEDKRSWYVRAGEDWLGRVTETEVLILALLAGFLFLGSWTLALWLRAGRPWGVPRKTLLIFFMVSVAIFAAKRIETRMIRDAIVMTKQAEVRFGPSEGDRVAFRLGEGLKVYVIDRRQDWSRIVLVNGDEGWIQNSKIAEVLA